MVQSHRTTSNLFMEEETWCVEYFQMSSGWCLCTRSGWFKHIEPHRSYTNHTMTEIARCVGCLCTRSGWFKHIEPHRTYTNHTSTELARCLVCLCTTHPPVKVLYTLCFLCNEEVREGSKRFDAVETPRPSI